MRNQSLLVSRVTRKLSESFSAHRNGLFIWIIMCWVNFFLCDVCLRVFCFVRTMSLARMSQGEN